MTNRSYTLGIHRYPLILLSLFPIVSLVDVFLPNADVLRAGGIRFLPLDPVYFLMIVYLGWRAVTRPKATLATLKENKFLTMFLALLAVNIAIYTPIYGQSAIGEARKFYFMFLFPLVAAVSVRRPEDLKRLLLVVVMLASLLAVAATANAAMQGSIVRVLNSEGTLIMALVALSLLLLRINKVILISPAVDTVLLCVLSFLVIGSGQRSVWLAVGLGPMFLLWLYRGRVVVIVKIMMIAMMLLATATVAIVTFPGAGAKLVEKVSGIIDPYSDKTASWRIRGWREQLETVREVGPLFGEGVGGYYSWSFGRDEITVQPHNAYIQIVLKFGLVGLTFYALLAFAFFRKMLAIRKKIPPGPMRACVEMGIVNFGAAHGYMLGYAFEPIMLIFFGVAVSSAKLCQRSFQTARLQRAHSARNGPGGASHGFRPQRALGAVQR